MTERTLQGTEAVMQALKKIAAQMGGGAVEVGFAAGANYPDGTPVAAVAYWNEFGKPGQVPRPFFRRMIAKESPTWPQKMARLAAATNYNGPRVLAAMGEDIKAALDQSIKDFTTPGLKASTIEAKGFSKPLIDTNDMINSITYKVTT